MHGDALVNEMWAKENCLVLSFFFLLIAPQGNFLVQGAFPLLYASGFVLAMAGLQVIAVERRWVKYIALATFLFILSLILRAVGVSGDFTPRPLFLHSLALIVMLMVAAVLNRTPLLRSRALGVVLIVFVVEILIIFLQFSYITWGYGFAPRSDLADQAGVLTGSYGNPNNVAVLVGLFLLLLVQKNVVERNFFGVVLFAAAGIAIFLTLSRTVLVVYVTMVIYFLVKKSGGSSVGRFGFSFCAALLILVFVVSGLLDAGVFGKNVVLDRSIDRMASIAAIEQDQSVDFRVVSVKRLWGNYFGLGMGTFSDLNYGRYFESYDSWLAKVNPHSFVAEISFLFGYFGLFFALLLFLFLFRDSYLQSGSLLFAAYFILVFAFFQSVPSSVLAIPAFFLVAIMIAAFKSVHGQDD